MIGLQSTGEARAKAAADQVDFESKDDGALVMEDYISDSKEGLKRTLMNIFPLPPKPRGVKPPAFLKTVLADREKYTDGLSDDPATSDASNPARESLPARKSARVRDLYKPNSAMYGLSSEDEDSSHGHHEEDDRMTSSSNASSEDEDMGLLSDDDDDDDADAAERRREETDKLRHVNYAEAIQRLERWFQAVNSLALPPNALDRLLNELGGPEMVAEMTGRRTRQIQRLVNGKLKTVFEKREAAGALDQINIEERDHFQVGVGLYDVL